MAREPRERITSQPPTGPPRRRIDMATPGAGNQGQRDSARANEILVTRTSPTRFAIDGSEAVGGSGRELGSHPIRYDFPALRGHQPSPNLGSIIRSFVYSFWLARSLAFIAITPPWSLCPKAQALHSHKLEHKHNRGRTERETS